MLASDASTNSTQAYKCPNPYSCAMPRHQMMRPSLTSSTGFKEGACPFLLVAPLVTSSGIPDEGSSMCATGIDASSLGCTKCAKDFGRKDNDPFSCEPCGKLDSAMKWWAAWLAQPMILFLLSMRSAENAAASRGMAAALANDVVKIVLAYLSSISVVVSSVTSTDAYRELNAADRARQTLRLTRQTAQRGDVTYSSSSDCLLMDGQGAASVNQLVALSLQKPACVLAVAAALIAIRACGRAAFSGSTLDLKELRAEVLNSLVTCSLVAGNQFLPGVAAAGMRALPCFHMQTAFDGEGPLQFMAYDPDTACRAHTRYLATCGPALAFAFAAGPAYWMTLLRRWQGAQQGGPLRFLTGSYRAGFHWWESGRLSKTMLIACVVTASPKSYCPLQQLQLCLLVTVAYGFWHCFNRPYKHLVLNVAEAGSLFTLSVGMVLSGECWRAAGGRSPRASGAASSPASLRCCSSTFSDWRASG
ncbi:unnamed protein product [Prorocentrum cordatum]|uniref:Protein RFT1 homolog n=1 Tax=Prorocentrum cordatum TaxID=2364126 RepID=A0ABN9PJQ5_9DINO|nr:unnamed protein product [Polarella glacialis]